MDSDPAFDGSNCLGTCAYGLVMWAYLLRPEAEATALRPKLAAGLTNMGAGARFSGLTARALAAKAGDTPRDDDDSRGVAPSRPHQLPLTIEEYLLCCMMCALVQAPVFLMWEFFRSI